MSEKLKPGHRAKVENDMIRRRDKEMQYQEMWTGAEKYYKNWEKKNAKFDDWTSPRYYEENTKLITDIREKRNKEELLEKRREKLKKLLDEEQRTHDIELMVRKTREMKTSRNKTDDIPLEVLKDVNIGLKLEEEDRQRHEAEIKLYHQWRTNNPILRNYEKSYRCKDIKLSWLDQQIERRIQKEKEEEECKKLLKEREERMKLDKENDERFKKEQEAKTKAIYQKIQEQIEELKRKQEISEKLQREEDEEHKNKLKLIELEELQQLEERRRRDRECALYNIRQHKLKLKQKLSDIQENLNHEKELILKLKQLDLDDFIEDQRKRNEIKEGLTQFLSLVRDQQDLEKQRQRYLEFIFDSEAKSIYDKQNELWLSEESSRKKLMNDVISSVKQQIEQNLERNKERQKEILREREEMTKMIEEYDKELENLKQYEAKRQIDRRKMIEEDIKVKNARKKQIENKKLREIDDELERVRREENRLRHEIMNIQKRQGPIRPGRSRIFF